MCLILFHSVEKISDFLQTFNTKSIDGTVTYKYADLLTNIAHREEVSVRNRRSKRIITLCLVTDSLLFQVDLCIELDDVEEFDSELAEAIVGNTKRFVTLFSDIVEKILPNFKHRDVNRISTTTNP